MVEKEYTIKIPYGKKVNCSTNYLGQTTYTLVDDYPTCWNDVLEWHINQKDASDTYKAYVNLASLPKDERAIYKSVLSTLKLRMVIESLQDIEKQSLHYGELDNVRKEFYMYTIIYNDYGNNGTYLSLEYVEILPYHVISVPVPKWMLFYTKEICNNLIQNFEYILFNYFEDEGE
jgi:hypothetical protein